MAIGSHHSNRIGTYEWLTPPEIIKELGPFDLDPCAPKIRPWNTAKHHYHLPAGPLKKDGLDQEWFGRVWLNPPYGKQTGRWLKTLALHGNGIALVFARTETKKFFDWVWPYCSGILFLKGRLAFYTGDGIRAKSNAGGPSVLIAYGIKNAKILKASHIEGHFLYNHYKEQSRDYKRGSRS